MRKRLMLSDNERNELNRSIKMHGSDASDNLIVLIQRPNGNSISNDVIAVGKYEASEERWQFESDEDALKQWLETAFSQPLNSRHGQIPINSVDFVEKIKDTVMTRRGLVLTVKA